MMVIIKKCHRIGRIALAHVRKDHVVYRGLAGQYFLRDIPHVLKVRIIADMQDRGREEMRRAAMRKGRSKRSPGRWKGWPKWSSMRMPPGSSVITSILFTISDCAPVHLAEKRPYRKLNCWIQSVGQP